MIKEKLSDTDLLSISDLAKNPSKVFEELARTGKKVIVVKNNKALGYVEALANSFHKEN